MASGRGGNSTAARKSRKYKRGKGGQFGGGPSALPVRGGRVGPVRKAVAKRIKRKPQAKRSRTTTTVKARAGKVHVPGIVEVRNASAKVKVKRTRRTGKAATRR